MASTYAGDPTAFPVTFDILDDGDARNAATLDVAPEALGDRTAFVKAAITPITLSDLRAINTTDGAVWPTGIVRNVLQVGAYYLDRSSADPELIPNVIVPTTGAGRWLALTPFASTRTLVMPLWNVPALATGWVNSYAPPMISDPGDGTPQIVPIPPGCLHDGATLSSVVMVYLAAAHGALPANQPKFELLRYPRTAGNDPAAYVTLGTYSQAAFGSVGAYTNSGHAVEWTYTPSTNNVIDKAAYAYAILLIPESGANAASGNSWHGARLSFSKAAVGVYP